MNPIEILRVTESLALGCGSNVLFTRLRLGNENGIISNEDEIWPQCHERRCVFEEDQPMTGQMMTRGRFPYLLCGD